MRRTESEIGIIENLQAGDRKSVKQMIKTIEQPFGEAKVYDLRDFENGNMQNIPPRLIIIGGDGTIRATFSWLATHDEYPQVLIAGGGSTNTLRTALLEEGAGISVQAVERDDPIAIDYKPAVIEHEDGEKDFWVIAAGFGEFEKDFAVAFETVRKSKIPHRARAYTAGLMALMQNFLSTMSSQDPLIQAYTTGRSIGSFKVFKENELSLSSDKLGLTEIDKKDYYWGFLRFIISSMFWQTGVRPPKFLTHAKTGDSFKANLKSLDDTASVNLDGDEKYIQSGRLSIRRHPLSFPVSALVFDRKTQGKI